MAGGPGRRGAPRTVRTALWWATAANGVACLILLATAGLWAQRVETSAPPRIRFPGFAWLLVAAALLCGALRWPLAHSSVWPDEAWSVENTIAGIRKTVRRDPTRLRTRVVTWEQALFDYRRPTNHVLYSLAARASNEAWRRASGAQAPAFDAWAIRLPAWLAAVATVPLLGLLLAAWGSAPAGAAAAFLLALHPWHVAHGAEARGYAFVVLFAVAACLALTRALASGAWRHWLGFAVAIWLLVWSHLFAVFLAAGLALAAVGGAFWGSPRPERRTRTARALVAQVAAGMLVLQTMAPNLAQIPGWREHFVARSETQLSLPALGHLWVFAATGLEASHQGAPPERVPGAYPSLTTLARQRLWMLPVVLGVIPLLCALGGLRVLARGGPGRATALGLAGSIPLALAATWLQGGQWYPRFAIWSLVAVVAFAAIGLQTLLEQAPRRLRKASVAGGLALGVMGFALLVAPQLYLLLTRPQLPSREAVAFVHKDGGERAIGAVLGLSGGNMHFVLYDPWLREFEDADELEALMDESRREGRPLYVIYAYAYKNRDVRPSAFRLLDDPALFQEAAVFHAIFDERMVRVLRFSGSEGLTPRRARLVWGFVLAVLVVFLLLAPKPWSFPTGPDFFGRASAR